MPRRKIRKKTIILTNLFIFSFKRGLSECAKCSIPITLKKILHQSHKKGIFAVETFFIYN